MIVHVVAAEELPRVETLMNYLPLLIATSVASWLLIATAHVLIGRNARRQGAKRVALISWIVSVLAIAVAPAQVVFILASQAFSIVFFESGPFDDIAPDLLYVVTAGTLSLVMLWSAFALRSTWNAVSGLAGCATAALIAYFSVMVAAEFPFDPDGHPVLSVLVTFALSQFCTVVWMLSIALAGVSSYRRVVARRPVPSA